MSILMYELKISSENVVHKNVLFENLDEHPGPGTFVHEARVWGS